MNAHGSTCPPKPVAAEARESVQLGKLRALLGQVFPANAFYARKLGGNSSLLTPDSISAFAGTIPFTTKHELVRDQLEHPPYGTNLTFPQEQYTRCHQTSGTTAAPLRWLDTEQSWSGILDNWSRIFHAAGITGQDRFLFAFSFGPFLGFWSAFEAALRQGCFCFPAGAMTSLARLHAILDNRVTALCCTPTYALRLGEVAQERKLDLSQSRVRRIVVAGEAGGSVPSVRARLEALWPGARVFDHHGMTEVGPVTYQCPAQPGLLHIIESAYLAEIVDPKSGLAVPPGQLGELVLTTLNRAASPLLRYRTGDLVRVRPGSCPCGTDDLGLAGGILGRSDDMVVVRGVNVFPSTVDDLVRAAGDVAEYRVTLQCGGGLTEISLEVEAGAGCPDPLALRRHLEQSLQAALHLRVPVRLAPAGSLPRFEMKARRWLKTAG